MSTHEDLRRILARDFNGTHPLAESLRVAPADPQELLVLRLIARLLESIDVRLERQAEPQRKSVPVDEPSDGMLKVLLGSTGDVEITTDLMCQAGMDCRARRALIVARRDYGVKYVSQIEEELLRPIDGVGKKTIAEVMAFKRWMLTGEKS